MNRRELIDLLLARWAETSPDAGDQTALSSMVTYLDSLPDAELAALANPGAGPALTRRQQQQEAIGRTATGAASAVGGALGAVGGALGTYKGLITGEPYRQPVPPAPGGGGYQPYTAPPVELPPAAEEVPVWEEPPQIAPPPPEFTPPPTAEGPPSPATRFTEVPSGMAETYSEPPPQAPGMGLPGIEGDLTVPGIGGGGLGGGLGPGPGPNQRAYEGRSRTTSGNAPAPPGADPALWDGTAGRHGIPYNIGPGGTRTAEYIPERDDYRPDLGDVPPTRNGVPYNVRPNGMTTLEYNERRDRPERQDLMLADRYTTAFGFNQRYSNPFNPAIPNHRGVDLILADKPNNGRGEPFQAFQPGTVAHVTKDKNGGNGIIIQGDDGLYHRYFHADRIDVKPGQRVAAGEDIGIIGASGTEGFPHLHFEVSRDKNGDPQNALIDPHPYMTAAAPTGPAAAGRVGQGGPYLGANNRLVFSPYDDVFMKYMPPELQADDTFRAIVAAGAFAESGFDPKRKNQQGEDSHGLFMMNRAGGAGTGYSIEQLQDPELQSRIMIPKYAAAYQQMRAQFPDASPSHLAALVAGKAEMPSGIDIRTGILPENTQSYRNYANAWNRVSSGTGTYAGPGAATAGAASPLPSPPSGGFGGLAGGLDYRARLADAFTEALQTADPDKIEALSTIYAVNDKIASDYLTMAARYGEQAADNMLTKRAQDISVRGQDITGRHYNQTYDLGLRQLDQAYAKLGLDRYSTENTVAQGWQNLALSEANIMGYYGGMPTWEREKAMMDLALQAGTLTGNIPEQFGGGRSIAARTLEEQVENNRNMLRKGFAEFQSQQDIALQTARQNALTLAQTQAENAPMLDPSGQYVMGHEPGGFVSGLRGQLGMPFSPLAVSQLPRGPDPYQGVQQLEAAFARRAAEYPQPRY